MDHRLLISVLLQGGETKRYVSDSVPSVSDGDLRISHAFGIDAPVPMRDTVTYQYGDWVDCSFCPVPQ